MTSRTQSFSISSLMNPCVLSGHSVMLDPILSSSGQSAASLMLSNVTLDVNRLTERFASVDVTTKNQENLERFSVKKTLESQIAAKQLMQSTLPVKKRFTNTEELSRNASVTLDHLSELVPKKLQYDPSKKNLEIVELPSRNDEKDTLWYGKTTTASLSTLADCAVFYRLNQNIFIADSLSISPNSEPHDETHESHSTQTRDSSCITNYDVPAPPCTSQTEAVAEELSAEAPSQDSLNDSLVLSPNGSDVEVPSPKRSPKRPFYQIDDTEEDDIIASSSGEEEAPEEPSDDEYDSSDNDNNNNRAPTRSPQRAGRDKPPRLSKAQAAILRDWFDANIDKPFPNRQHKLELCKKAGCEMKQLTNWFYNARKTILPTKRQKKH